MTSNPPSQTIAASSPEQSALGSMEMLALHREFPGEAFHEVVAMFQEEAVVLMEQLAGAAERRDRDALRRTTHALHGACVNFGAGPLAALCRKIELSARGGDLEVSSLLEQVRAEYRRVEMALLQECRTGHSL